MPQKSLVSKGSLCARGAPAPLAGGDADAALAGAVGMRAGPMAMRMIVAVTAGRVRVMVRHKAR
jgi:hypothetical protein